MPPFWTSPLYCRWFQVLKLSARSSKRSRSVKVKFLNNARFQLSRPGPRNASCGRLPHCPAAGCAKDEGSNHWKTPPTNCFVYLIGATRFGRVAELGIIVSIRPLPFSVMLSGAPDCMVIMPDTCQPPIVPLRNLLELFLRNGTSYTKLTKAMCRRSKIDGPSSY